MTCGLPTFATCHGGPAEIIENGVSGFHIDPYHPDQVATTMVDFFEKCKEDSSHWNKISDAGLQRIYERFVSLDGFDTWSLYMAHSYIRNCRYTWKIYSERLMTLAGVYGFWKYVSKLSRRETRRYLEMFYTLKFRDLVSPSALYFCFASYVLRSQNLGRHRLGRMAGCMPWIIWCWLWRAQSAPRDFNSCWLNALDYAVLVVMGTICTRRFSLKGAVMKGSSLIKFKKKKDLNYLVKCFKRKNAQHSQKWNYVFWCCRNKNLIEFIISYSFRQNLFPWRSMTNIKLWDTNRDWHHNGRIWIKLYLCEYV